MTLYKCINDEGLVNLTQGKVYAITTTSDGSGMVVLHDDSGEVRRFDASRFEWVPPTAPGADTILAALGVSIPELQMELAAKEDQHYKADAGKLKPSLLFDGMPNALLAVTAVLSYGAQKYEAHSWKNVDMARYEDAKERHNLARRTGELCDDESGLLHLAHEACNALFLLEDYMSKSPDRASFLVYLPPPTGHKK